MIIMVEECDGLLFFVMPKHAFVSMQTLPVCHLSRDAFVPLMVRDDDICLYLIGPVAPLDESTPVGVTNMI